jgi:hypothetical protein
MEQVISSARGFLDKTPIDSDCPECRRKVRQTIGVERRIDRFGR